MADDLEFGGPDWADREARKLWDRLGTGIDAFTSPQDAVYSKQSWIAYALRVAYKRGQNSAILKPIPEKTAKPLICFKKGEGFLEHPGWMAPREDGNPWHCVRCQAPRPPESRSQETARKPFNESDYRHSSTTEDLLQEDVRCPIEALVNGYEARFGGDLTPQLKWLKEQVPQEPKLLGNGAYGCSYCIKMFETKRDAINHNCVPVKPIPQKPRSGP
jgi:hypothetical protein